MKNAGWGTNEKGIIEIIGHRNAGQRKLIKEAYEQQYNENLIKRFEKELSGDFEVTISDHYTIFSIFRLFIIVLFWSKLFSHSILYRIGKIDKTLILICGKDHVFL